MRRLLPAVLALAAACSGSHPERPNVVLIVVDTLRADHADSRAGRAQTPAVDRLAAEGVRFPLAFAHAPMTLPSHAALFSSRVPGETTVVNNGQRVPLDVPLLGAWLAEHGYSCGAAVSLGTMWPLGTGEGLDRGFATYDIGRFELSRAEDVNARLEPLLDGLERKQPFFLFAHYSEPHEPYDAHGAVQKFGEVLLDGALLTSVATATWSQGTFPLDLAPGQHVVEVRAGHTFKVRQLAVSGSDGPLEVEWLEGAPLQRVERLVARVIVPPGGLRDGKLDLWVHDVPARDEFASRYRGEAEHADRAVGQLLDGLRARGLFDASLIVFTSDHGEALGEHKTVGHVRTLFDELLHVPLVIKPPQGHAGRARLAEASQELVRHIDVAPTVLELLDLPALPGQHGTSLLERHDPRLLSAETHRPEAPRDLFCLRDRRTKLIYSPETGRFEMYDLVSDPGELEDVFERDGARVVEWQELLREMAARSKGPGIDRKDLDPATRARLETLGYL